MASQFFDHLTKDFGPPTSLPDTWPVMCYQCDWEGELRDCDTVLEQDTWELLAYKISICPVCRGVIEP